MKRLKLLSILASPLLLFTFSESKAEVITTKKYNQNPLIAHQDTVVKKVVILNSDEERRKMSPNANVENNQSQVSGQGFFDSYKNSYVPGQEKKTIVTTKKITKEVDEVEEDEREELLKAIEQLEEINKASIQQHNELNAKREAYNKEIEKARKAQKIQKKKNKSSNSTASIKKKKRRGKTLNTDLTLDR